MLEIDVAFPESNSFGVVDGSALIIVSFDCGSISLWLTLTDMQNLAQKLIRKAAAMEAKLEATVTA